MVSALYYDDCQCLSEVVGDSRAHLDPKPPQKPATEKQTKKIQSWLKKEFGKEFTCEGDKMKHGKQEDTVNCGVYHPNTTEHELFSVEILTHGKRHLAHMQWFIRLARAQLEHVSYQNTMVFIAYSLQFTHRMPDCLCQRTLMWSMRHCLFMKRCPCKTPIFWTCMIG